MVNSITFGNQTFTFADGMIAKITTEVNGGLEEMTMAGSGPLANYGTISEGINKVITVIGEFFDTDSSVLNVADMRDRYLMKYWFESIKNGSVPLLTLNFDGDEYSVQGSGTTDFVDSVSGATITLRATFGQTKGYLRNAAFEKETPNNTIPFTLTFWVGGV